MKNRWVAFVLVLGIMGAISALMSSSSQSSSPPSSPPPLPDGTEAALKNAARFQLPAELKKTFKIELFAAEPKLASPVAICIDDKGRVFVAEEYRFNLGTEENRTRPFLLEDDLQIRTLDDRLKVYKKWAGKFEGGMDWFSKHADQVRLLEDRDGDGKADFSSVFADGFNDPLDGLAAGVIAREDSVYFTCIPNLWLLQDTKGSGKADVRKVIHRGFGVNCAFLGHDLHGLAWGPDGKLYFSVGDRGFHVETKEGATLSGPRTGAVFRCNPDGTELEVVARGLRNPQELAFDQHGNLFAADNNCDKGDHARLVYVIEGGDSGWNMAFQTIPDPYLTGPWHAERMWHMPHKGQPAWLQPPVGKLGAGPSGFTFTSGLSLPARYRNRFFMCNYTGNGGIEAFGVVPRGAGFEIVDYHDFLKPIVATDVDFGYDGKMYVSDFVNLLWNGGSAGGRIYTVFDPERIKDPAVVQTRELFEKGFRKRPDDELVKLLHHEDLRVRQRAQFALAEKGESAVAVLEKTARERQHPLARLHAVWGLGQLAGKRPQLLTNLLDLLEDEDAEVRCQTARILGDRKYETSAKKLLGMLKDVNPRVRFFAIMALGKQRCNEAIPAIFEVLKENNDQDVYLRQAGITALEWIGDKEAVQKRSKDTAPAIRLAVLLVQRRWNDRRVTQFLEDENHDIAMEAARAVHDLPIEEETETLAQTLDRLGKSPAVGLEPWLRRAIHAHFRLGRAANARAAVSAAMNPHLPTAIRAEALDCLLDWTEPGPRDRVTGFWRPLAKREPTILRQAVEESTTELLTKTSGPLQLKAIQLIDRAGVQTDEKQFFEWCSDANRERALRIASLRLLMGRKSQFLTRALASCATDTDASVRAEALAGFAALEGEKVLPRLRTVLENDAAEIVEKQRAVALLAGMQGDIGSALLDEWAGKLSAGAVHESLQLDVLEALKSRSTDKRKQIVQKFESAPPTNNLPAKFRVSLHGGDAERGRELFVGHSAAQCIRCHNTDGRSGTAGPDLAKVTERNPTNTRDYLLESMLYPDAKLAKGFGSVVLTLSNGKVLSGTLQVEDAKSLTILLTDGKKQVVMKNDIDERSNPTSAMPSMERLLTPRELRDLVEYLATLK